MARLVIERTMRTAPGRVGDSTETYHREQNALHYLSMMPEPSQTPMSDETIREVLVELQRCFRVAGRGAVSQVEKGLKLGTGYFKDQRRPDRQRVDLKILFQALDALEIDSSEFFASVLGPADPIKRFKAEAALLSRKKKMPRALVLEAERDEATVEGVLPDLAALDGLRHANPSLAMRRGRALIRRITASHLPVLLAIYASACRVAGRLEEAQMVLARVLELAEERGDEGQLGDALLRAGYVAAARAEAHDALALAEKATLVFVRSGDLAGIGRALTDQGHWLVHLDRPRRAYQSFLTALEYLPENGDAALQRNRVSCFSNLGMLHLQLGNLEAAQRYARRARENSRGADHAVQGMLVAQQAFFDRRAGRYRRAEELFREALDMLQPVSPLDAALCGVELTRVQLQRGKAARARATARALMPLVEPLERTPLAAAALTELLRHALAGHGLTTAVLTKVARGLEAGRARPGIGRSRTGRPGAGARRSRS